MRPSDLDLRLADTFLSDPLGRRYIGTFEAIWPGSPELATANLDRRPGRFAVIRKLNAFAGVWIPVRVWRLEVSGCQSVRWSVTIDGLNFHFALHEFMWGKTLELNPELEKIPQKKEP